MQEGISANNPLKKLTEEQYVSYSDSLARLISKFVRLKLVDEDSGLDLISRLKSKEIDLLAVNDEAIVLLEKRLEALEKIKEDKTIKKEKLDEINSLQETIDLIMKEIRIGQKKKDVRLN
ncbi:MAG: hypothetical protein ABH951_01385 [Patescibacteria group bacterium]